jgi:hypothetical protein
VTNCVVPGSMRYTKASEVIVEASSLVRASSLAVAQHCQTDHIPPRICHELQIVQKVIGPEERDVDRSADSWLAKLSIRDRSTSGADFLGD